MRALLALTAVAACGDSHPVPPPAASRLPTAAPGASQPVAFNVRGSVIDRDTGHTVGDVEVVLRGEHGDVTTRTAGDGTFSVAVARGAYRAFVRDERVISTGMQGRPRLRTLPAKELAGAEDDKLMPVLEITADTAHVELTVTAAAVLDGIIVDPDGKPAADVVVSAMPLDMPPALLPATSPRPMTVMRHRARPVLGTDTAISDRRGAFTLRVPAGTYSLVANHPRFAGIGGVADVDLVTGTTLNATLTLARGCVISGKVVSADGTPVHDGALETQRMSDMSFVPSGRVRSDGTFRWTTLDHGFVAIRAWPWQQPASAPRTFECSEGKTYSDVVLVLPPATPDIAGTLTDAHGHPVPLAHVDIQSIDRGFDGQQERADAGGRWSVFDMPAGRYQITATAAGRGIAAETISAPRHDVALELSGTGRIAGTTTELVDGSFELTFHHCGAATDAIELDDDARIVLVRGGRFVVDRVPACTLTLSARWRDKLVPHTVVVEPDRTAYIEIALGPPRKKQVHGVVRDGSGKPVANARVTAVVDSAEATTVRTDARGRYMLETAPGAQLVAGSGDRAGRATVGRANVPTEQVDIALTSAADSY